MRSAIFHPEAEEEFIAAARFYERHGDEAAGRLRCPPLIAKALARLKMNDLFELDANHRRWARNAQRKYGRTVEYWLDLIARQRGCCAFSGAPLRFDALSGTPVAGGEGAHPLYAAVDHTSPGSDHLGHKVVSYDLNDLKGHLPSDCFQALAGTDPWKRLMNAWRDQALKDPGDRAAFRRIRDGTVKWRKLANHRSEPAGHLTR